MPGREILRRDLHTKSVYHFVDPENDIDVKSRETFKRRRRTVHFPFNTRSGTPRYGTPLKITYDDVPTPLPAGFIKAPTKGYGFTRELYPVFKALKSKYPDINHIVVTTKEESSVPSSSKVILSLADLQRARPLIKAVLDRNKEELAIRTNNALSEFLPDEFPITRIRFRPGQLLQYIRGAALRPSQLSIDDLESVTDLIGQIPGDHPFFMRRDMLSTKTSFDLILVENLIKQYKILLGRKTDTKRLEDRWQEFFSDNLLFFNFGYVHKFEKEIISGDKSLNIPDFVMLNTFGYLDVYEIKTHLTQLLSFDTGRKNFYWSSKASQAISQAENYIYSLVKNEDTVMKNILDEYDVRVDTIRPIAYILASTKQNIAGPESTIKYRGGRWHKLMNDYRRLNNGLKDVRFVLYDELLLVFQTTMKRLGSDING